MPIIIKPGEFKIIGVTFTSANTTTFTWAEESRTATTKDVEMSRSEHQVHVTTDDNEEVILECWTCTGFPQLAKLGKNPNVTDVYSAAAQHWNS